MLEKPVLIAYATRLGSSREIAQEIEFQLESKGVKAEARNLEDLKSLSGYRAVILGSSIRENEPLPEALEFVQKHQAELKNLPVFYFVVSLTMQQDTPDHAQTALGYLKPLRRLIEPKEVGLFAGKFDPEALTRTAEQKLQAKGFLEGDWRDWEAIHAWGTRVAELLLQEEVARGI